MAAFRGLVVSLVVSKPILRAFYLLTGGKGIRTPDFQLAKLALYQLSYAPEKNCGM